MNDLDDIIEKLIHVRWMRAAYGGDYDQLGSGCEACHAPPGQHWPDCNRDDRDRPMLTEYL